MLSDPNMTIPKRGNIFAINEGYAKYWDEDVTEYVRQCKFPEVGRYNQSYVPYHIKSRYRRASHQ